MLMTFPVVSGADRQIPVTLIPVTAPGIRLGKKLARHIARTQLGISKPKVLADRQAIQQIRREAEEIHRLAIQAVLSGNLPKWWVGPTRISDLYEER